jgi:hypothetical protein
MPCIRRVARSLLVLASVATASNAAAQVPVVAPDSAAPAPLVSFGVAGGFAQGTPFGIGASDIGYAALATAEVRTPLRALRLRGDGLLANWGRDRRVYALTASALALPPARWPAVPYLSAGGGAYALGLGARPSPGWTLGGGLRLPAGRRTVFVESRMHAVSVGRRDLDRVGVPDYDLRYSRWQYTYTPLTVGVQF